MMIFDNIFIQKDFYFKDIEGDAKFIQRCADEALRISNDSKLHCGRTYSQVVKHVKQGLALEHLIAKNHPNLFLSRDGVHDLCHNITGEFVELKAYSTEDENNAYIVKNVQYLKKSNINKSSYMVVYSYYKNEGRYSFLTCIKI